MNAHTKRLSAALLAGLFVLGACSGGKGDQPHDGDGLTKAEEEELGTDPNKSDTDDDGWDDKTEVDEDTDPLDADDHPEGEPPPLPSDDERPTTTSGG